MGSFEGEEILRENSDSLSLLHCGQCMNKNKKNTENLTEQKPKQTAPNKLAKKTKRKKQREEKKKENFIQHQPSQSIERVFKTSKGP